MEKAKQKLSKQLVNEEKKKDFPYLDTRSNYTTGVGHMRKKRYDFAQHPWIKRDTGTWASYDEIDSGLANLDKQPQNRVADFYKNKTNLSLPKGYVDYLFELDMASRFRELKRGIPNFEKMSPDMQIALMEPHFTSNILPWPKLREAAKRWIKREFVKNCIVMKPVGRIWSIATNGSMSSV